VFGAEIAGLSNAEVGLCHELVTIPANEEFSSLNLGAAVQVMAYELRMAAMGAAPTPEHGTDEAAVGEAARELARFEDTENFFRHLEQTMIETGFLDPANPKRLMPRIRRLFSRTSLEKEEVNILRGLLTSLKFPKVR
jgi:tRNA/rRNA methyltransferase